MSETILRLGAHLKAVQSKRPGWAVGLWGEAGVGKTFTVHTLLGQSPVKSLSLHATISAANLALALPRPGKLPLWAEQTLERLTGDRPVEANKHVDALVAILSGLAPFVLHLEDLHEAGEERLEGTTWPFSITTTYGSPITSSPVWPP
jgi:hypothetical protein